jgi:hypothetical protein
MWVRVVGLVLVRQNPGSAKGVMFIPVEGKSGIADLVICRVCSRRRGETHLAAGRATTSFLTRGSRVGGQTEGQELSVKQPPAHPLN